MTLETICLLGLIVVAIAVECALIWRLLGVERKNIELETKIANTTHLTKAVNDAFVQEAQTMRQAVGSHKTAIELTFSRVEAIAHKLGIEDANIRVVGESDTD
jgi:hypothetical protein